MFLIDRARLLAADQLRLDGPEGRHAATVRRLRPGERIDLTDGAGRVAECRVTGAVWDELELDVVAHRELARPQPRLTVVQAVPKGERGELAVEMLTEVGVDLIVPWSAARCVTMWRADRGARSLAKWRSTAREAAKQARRAWLPEVTELAGTAQVAERLRAATLGLVLHAADGQPIGTLEPLPGRRGGRARGRPGGRHQRRRASRVRHRRCPPLPARADRAANLDRRRGRRGGTAIPDSALVRSAPVAGSQ